VHIERVNRGEGEEGVNRKRKISWGLQMLELAGKKKLYWKNQVTN